MNDATTSASHAEQRRLAAIMFTDIVGFSRQMGADEARMLRLLTETLAEQRSIQTVWKLTLCSDRQRLYMRCDKSRVTCR